MYYRVYYFSYFNMAAELEEIDLETEIYFEVGLPEPESFIEYEDCTLLGYTDGRSVLESPKTLSSLTTSYRDIFAGSNKWSEAYMDAEENLITLDQLADEIGLIGIQRNLTITQMEQLPDFDDVIERNGWLPFYPYNQTQEKLETHLRSGAPVSLILDKSGEVVGFVVTALQEENEIIEEYMTVIDEKLIPCNVKGTNFEVENQIGLNYAELGIDKRYRDYGGSKMLDMYYMISLLAQKNTHITEETRFFSWTALKSSSAMFIIGVGFVPILSSQEIEGNDDAVFISTMVAKKYHKAFKKALSQGRMNVTKSMLIVLSNLLLSQGKSDIHKEFARLFDLKRMLATFTRRADSKKNKIS
jgi:hypothetical protein